MSLIGAGDHAHVVASSIVRGGGALSAVFDTDPSRIGGAFGSLVVQADRTVIEGPLHVAIGANAIRRAVVLARSGAVWASVIDPAAQIVDDVKIADGVLVGLGALVQTGVRIGRHVIVNTGAIVEHDCRVGDFCHLAPGSILTGGVMLGEGVLIGAGAVVLPGLAIGDGVVVGAGAVVTRSVAAGKTVVGAPARGYPTGSAG